MKYTKCVELCDKLPTSLEANLLKGKSLYNMYQKRQRQLRKRTLQPNEFYDQHKACYDMAKKVVKIFSSTDVQLDNNCSRMLDFAIMDYLLETNKLKDLRLCFLCLKKPKIDAKAEPISQEPDSNAMETSKKEVKPRPQRANIRTSHLIPRAIIQRLVKASLPDVPLSSKSVLFGVSRTKIESLIKLTPAKSSVYMLCPLCEHNLNILGEQPFLNFLEKVYDPSSSDTEVTHTYGREMYHFCIGLIFRTLIPSQDDYINTDEVYQLLLQCRAFLTVDNPLEAIEKMPDVFMFVCPSDDNAYDKALQAFIISNSTSFTSKISLDFRLEELGTFASVLANFFMVKVGTIIIVVKFQPAAKQVIDKKFCIIPEGACYSVPASKARRSMIPTGIWTALHLLYKEYEEDLSKNPI